ncbi:hypothetical protein FRC03_007443 [Tulasnella sp. 419]|nr:hypothetical protein FRC03_007443 [Tulasnella sp. 419]
MVSSLLLSSLVLLLALVLVPLHGSLGRLHHYSMSNIVYRHVVQAIFGIIYVLPLTWPFIKQEFAQGHVDCGINLILSTIGFATYHPVIILVLLNGALIPFLLLIFHSKWYMPALVSIPTLLSSFFLSLSAFAWLTGLARHLQKKSDLRSDERFADLIYTINAVNDSVSKNTVKILEIQLKNFLASHQGMGLFIANANHELLKAITMVIVDNKPRMDFLKSIEELIRELLNHQEGLQGMLVKKIDHIIVGCLSANFGEVKDLVTLESGTIQEAIELTRPPPPVDSSINPNDPMTKWIMTIDEGICELIKSVGQVMFELKSTRKALSEATTELRWDLNQNLDINSKDWQNKGADQRALLDVLNGFIKKTDNYRSNLQAHVLSIEDSNKKLAEQQDSLMKVSFRGGKTSEELLHGVQKLLNHNTSVIRGRIEVVGQEIKDTVYQRTATLNWDRESPTWIKQEKSSSLELDTREIAEVPSSPIEEDDELIVVKLESPPPPDLSGGFARRTPSSSLSSISD